MVSRPWVNTFVFGLVEAQPIDVSAQCPGGIAKVPGTARASAGNHHVSSLTYWMNPRFFATLSYSVRPGVLVLCVSQ